jgi:hypothetical protein
MSGLYGSNDREAAFIDMLNDQQEDIRVSYIRMIYREYVRKFLHIVLNAWLARVCVVL